MSNLQSTKQTSLIRRLLGYSFPHKKLFLSAFAMLIVAIGAEMLIPWLAKIIIDDVIIPQQFEWQALGLLLSLIVIAYLVSSFLTYIQNLLFRKGALLVVKDVRKQLFSHVLNYQISKFDKEPSGKLVSYIINDTEALRDMFMSTLPTVLQGTLRIIAIFIAIAILDWRLMLVSLVLIPVLLLTMQLYRKISMSAFEGVRSQISKINGRLSESLQGMTLIQSFRQESSFRAKFYNENNHWFEYKRRSVAIDSLMLLPLTRLISTLATAGILAWFAGASLTTVIEIGALYAFLNYIERFFDPFRQLSMELRKLQIATVSSKRIFEMLDEKNTHNSDTYEEQALNDKYDIEFRNVSFGYDENSPVLSDVSFTAKTGQYTAIVGHSGSGKSSIINVLMKFYNHQKGEILIGGQPLNKFSDAQIHKIFGLVSQDPVIFKGSALENINLSSDELGEDHAIKIAKQVNVHKFIDSLPNKYAHILGQGGAQLSTGESQLIAIARTLSHSPSIFLLDEATANIDSESEETVKAVLTKVQKGKTVIAIAHRISTVKYADQILVMNKGKVVQMGTHQQLISQPGDYQNLYLAQQQQEAEDLNNLTLGLTA